MELLSSQWKKMSHWYCEMFYLSLYSLFSPALRAVTGLMQYVDTRIFSRRMNMWEWKEKIERWKHKKRGKEFIKGRKKFKRRRKEELGQAWRNRGWLSVWFHESPPWKEKRGWRDRWLRVSSCVSNCAEMVTRCDLWCSELSTWKGKCSVCWKCNGCQT